MRALEGTDGVVRVHGALALGVDPGEDVEGVVGEEAATVEGVPEHLSDRGYLHVLLVVVAVHVGADVEDRAELVDVGLASGGGENAVIGEGMELGNISGEDLITGGHAGVAGNDSEVGAGDCEGGTAVEIVGAGGKGRGRGKYD